MGEYLDTEHGPLYWIDHGGTGSPVLLVHGLGGSTLNWEPVVAPLRAHGRVVALDLPGFGLTPPWRDYSVPTHRQAVETLLEHLGLPVTLFGNSMGGLIAEMVAARHPEMVERLVLVSPATPPRLPDARMDWSMAWRLGVQATPLLGTAYAKSWIRRHSAEELVRMGLAMITYDPARVPLEVVEKAVDLARIRKELPWAAEAVPRTAQSVALVYRRRRDYVAMIRRIRAPTLVVQGMGDRFVSPTAVEWLVWLRPDWTLVQMEGTGHTPQLDAPVRFLRVVEPWLGGIEPAEATA